MRLIRLIVAAGVVAFAAYAVYALTYEPLVCDTRSKQIQNRALAMFNLPRGPSIARNAQEGIATLQRCLVIRPTAIEMYMTVAVEDRILGRLQHAAQMYSEALKFDQRPELYFELGSTQLEMNQRDAAIASLTRACSFDINLANSIPDPSVAAIVVDAVRNQRAHGTAGH